MFTTRLYDLVVHTTPTDRMSVLVGGSACLHDKLTSERGRREREKEGGEKKSLKRTTTGKWKDERIKQGKGNGKMDESWGKWKKIGASDMKDRVLIMSTACAIGTYEYSNTKL